MGSAPGEGVIVNVVKTVVIRNVVPGVSAGTPAGLTPRRLEEIKDDWNRYERH